MTTYAHRATAARKARARKRAVESGAIYAGSVLLVLASIPFAVLLGLSFA